MNHPEVQRLQDVQDKKARGKGVPKKAKSKGALFTFTLIVSRITEPFTSRRQPEDKQEEEDFMIDALSYVHSNANYTVLHHHNSQRQHQEVHVSMG